MTEILNMTKQAQSPYVAVLDDFPIMGIGERAMGCKRYDECLYKAAVKDWDSFNCEGCEYEGRGALEFIDSAFIPEFIEPDMTFEEDLETELVDLFANFSSRSFIGEVIEYNDHAA